MLFSRAAATIAEARGCSLPCSRLATRRTSSVSLPPEAAITDSTVGLPSVRVPVLSKTKVSTFSRISKASAFLMQDAGSGAASGADHDRHGRS